ncbi:hypothetical protein HPB48_021847 [Haemaphysalis longicornis]|uniref:Alkaline phosphatase n=1 Tax=Haemaphysalis longicornis TaxID=44386 RepID=A0A9J6H5M0_HAELO|nr:hypothetical protein HPB48_021847 [Haemaphysalis longicornis]
MLEPSVELHSPRRRESLLPLYPASRPPGEDRPEFWRASGQRTLAELLAPTVPIVVDAPAKNVILFVGDGMGVSTTYAADRQVVDSASSATALFTGVKTRFRTVGVSSRALPKDCDSVAGNEVKSFLHRAQEKGLATGLVTTTRITHATPAAAYAHSANRDWENKTIKTNRSVCKSIARQLVEDEPGKNLTLSSWTSTTLTIVLEASIPKNACP